MKRTTAPNSVGGAFVDKVPGVTVGTTIIAEDQNNHQEEIANAIEGAGIALDGGDDGQLLKAIAALIYAPGSYWEFAALQTLAVTKPLLRIDDADHDISNANWPDLVTALRAEKVYSDGTTDHAVNVAGGVATFPNNSASNRLLAALAEEVLVHGGYGSWLSLNLGGTDYAITNVNAGARTVTVAAPPGDGAYTAIVYPYRIAGSATTARVRRVNGRALVGSTSQAGDTPDRMLLAGLRTRDRMQGHWHQIYYPAAGATPLAGYTGSANLLLGSAATAVGGTATSPITDGTNDTPRTGKTTDPRQAPVYLYLGGGRYIP
jgi:hypothetical protein